MVTTISIIELGEKMYVVFYNFNSQSCLMFMKSFFTKKWKVIRCNTIKPTDTLIIYIHLNN